MKLFSKVNAALVLLLIPVLFGVGSCSKQTPDTTSKDTTAHDTLVGNPKASPAVHTMAHVNGPVTLYYLATGQPTPQSVTINGVLQNLDAVPCQMKQILNVPAGNLTISVASAAGNLVNGYQVIDGAPSYSFAIVPDAMQAGHNFHISCNQAQTVVVIMDENLPGTIELSAKKK